MQAAAEVLGTSCGQVAIGMELTGRQSRLPLHDATDDVHLARRSTAAAILAGGGGQLGLHWCGEAGRPLVMKGRSVCPLRVLCLRNCVYAQVCMQASYKPPPASCTAGHRGRRPVVRCTALGSCGGQLETGALVTCVINGSCQNLPSSVH